MLPEWRRGFAFTYEKTARFDAETTRVSTTDYFKLKRERRTGDHWKFQSVKRPGPSRVLPFPRIIAVFKFSIF